MVALPRAGAAAGSGTRYTQRLHALDLATGADVPGSPVVISAPAFDPLMQNQRPGLMLANGSAAARRLKTFISGRLIRMDA